MRGIKTYIHQLEQWPNFQWEPDLLIDLLARVRNKQGLLTGKMHVLGFAMRSETYLETLSQDVIETSAIEDEVLDIAQVRSSVARQLGIEIGGMVASERDVDGIVEMLIDATQNWQQPLDPERLFGWHATLFPTGRSGMQKITAGNWRQDLGGPMQVVSGAIGKENVHFEAPQANLVAEEMQKFLLWFNNQDKTDLVIKAAIAHLWFVTIHPFEDGNGRIARAVADLMLCRSENIAQRFYSMSAQIKEQRKVYYDILESTQKGSLNITSWLQWFLSCLERAIDSSDVIVQKVMAKHKFWNDYKKVTFNERQIKIIELLFGDFYGKLTTSKWAKINKCSSDTALRDIQELIAAKVLTKSKSGGRSTSYSLCIY